MPIEQYSKDFSLPIPEEDNNQPSMNEGEASDRAFYASAVSDVDDPITAYENTKQELVSNGTSPFEENEIAKFEKEQQGEVKEKLLDLISSTELTLEQKKEKLRLYEKGDFVTRKLRDKYKLKYGTTAFTTDPMEQDAQTAHTAVANNNLDDSILDAESDDLDAAFDAAYEYYTTEGALKEAENKTKLGILDVEAFIKGFIPFLYSTGRQWSNAAVQKWKKDEVDWEEAKQYGEEGVEQLLDLVTSKNYLSGFDWRLAELSKRWGIYDTYEEYGGALSEKFAGKVSDMVEHMAEKAAENEVLGIKDKNQARLILDSILIAGPKAFQVSYKGAKVLYGKRNRSGELLDPDSPMPKDLKDITPDGPADVTVQVNPKAGSNMLVEALKDETGTMSLVLKAEPKSIISKYVMPKFDANPTSKIYKNVPDVGFRYNEIYPREWQVDLTEGQKIALQDTYFDNLVTSPTKRLNDIKARRNIAVSEANLHYHAPLSVINVLDNTLIGKQTYTPRPDYPYFRMEDVVEAANRLKAKIDRTFPEGERGTISIVDVNARPPKKYSNDLALQKEKKFSDPAYPKRFHIEWEYEHKWNPLETLTDPLAKKTLVSPLPGFIKDIDVTKFGNSGYLADNLLGGNRFADWVQGGMANNALKALQLEEKGLEPFRQDILKTPRKVQGALQELAHKQEQMGVDTFTLSEVDSMYRNLLSPNQVKQLYKAQIAWRKTQDFIYHLVNIAYKNEMANKGFTKVLKTPDNKMITFAKEKFQLPEKLDDVVIWDFDLGETGMPVPIGQVKRKKGQAGWFTEEGKQIVMLPERGIEVPGNIYYNYATFGNKVFLDMMPNQVVPKTPGYNPRRTKAHFYVDEIPLEATVNGIKIDKPEVLAQEFVRAKGASNFKKDAEALKRQFESNPENSGYRYVVREAKEQRLADQVAEFNFHDEMIGQARQRGETLVDLEGKAPVERMDVLTQDLVSKFSRHQAYRQYDNALETAFVKEYGDILPNKQFPKNEAEIVDLAKVTKPERVNQAKALYRQIQFYRSSSISKMDMGVQKALHGIADILENSPFAKAIAPITRDLGNLGVKPYNYLPRQLASLLFITLQVPFRHWLVQTAQLTEFAVAFPKQTAVAYRALPFVTLKLFSDSAALKPFKKVLDSEAFAKLSGKSAKELNDIVRAMESQGIKHAVDSNIIVRELLATTPDKLVKDFDNLIVSGSMDALRSSWNAVRTGTRIVGGVGFGVGEMTNRIGTWMLTYELDRGKPSFKLSPEAIAEISAKADKRAGSPTKAGSMPILNVPGVGAFYQFINIIKNLQNNLFIKDAIKMSNRERAKLTIAGGVMNGLVAGIPILGVTHVIYNLLNETTDLDPELRKAFNMGLYDLMLGSDNAHVSTNKYGDTGFYITDLINASINPFTPDAYNPNRFPGHVAATRVGKTIKNVYTLFEIKDLDQFTLEDWQLLGRFMAKTASGGTNALKSQMLNQYKTALSKSGQPLGVQTTNWEATLALAGITPKEFDLLYKEEKARLERKGGGTGGQMAKDVSFINEFINEAIQVHREDNDIQSYKRKMRMANLLLNTYRDKYTTAELNEMGNQILYAIRPTNLRKTKLETLVEYWWENYDGEFNREFQRLENNLRYIKPELGPRLDKLKDLKNPRPAKDNKERQKDLDQIKREYGRN